MTWGNFKPDSVSEAYKKMKAEELKGKQHKLDVDKDGKIEGEDLAKLRKEETVEETVNKSDIPAYKRKNDKLTLADLEKERTQNKSHSVQLAKNNGTMKKEEIELTEEELDEISKTLAANYRHKASQQAVKAYIDNKPTSFLGINIPVSKKTAEKNSALIRKRGKGMSAASDRLSGAKPTSEEVEELVEYETKDGVYKHQAKAGRYGGSEKESDYVKGPSDAQLKKIEAEKKKVKKEGLDLFSEREIDTLISEVLKASDDAGKWISDFVSSDNPKFAGKSKADRKKQALAAYYAAQKKESVDYDSFLEEEVDLVKTSAKEIKHANIKDKDDDKDTMEPRAQGEKDFLDKLTVNVTDDPATDGVNTGTSKVSTATKPVGQGAGKYDGKGKTGVKESAAEATSEEDTTGEDQSISKAKGKDCSCKEDCSCKKSYTTFKEKMNKAC